MKHPVQVDVEDFHRVVVGLPDSATPQIRRPALRAELLMEEVVETVEAITGWEIRWDYRGAREPDPADGDLVAAIDGLCDVLCVTYGAAAEFGVDLAPFWDEVHRTNMAKAGGPTRADGKKMKPPGWRPPDIAGLLERLYGVR